jgi:hypothetical protein
MVGTSLTPRHANGNIDWEEIWRQYVKPIIRNQIAPNTGRGLMYIIKSKGVLVKNDYKGLINHLRDWRKDGRIEWNQIADGSGRGIMNDFNDFETPDEFIRCHYYSIRHAGNIYCDYLQRDWRWYGQKYYVEFWLEKHAIAGTVAALVGNRYVRVGFNRGNVGWRYMHDNCLRLQGELYTRDVNSSDSSKKIRRTIHLYYLGDNDLQGNHMDQEIRNQLAFFGMLHAVDIKRIALTNAQVKSYNLPRNFESDEGYEVDALNAYNPEQFAKLINDHINPHFDKDIHTKVLQLPEFQPETIDKRIGRKIIFLDDYDIIKKKKKIKIKIKSA